MIKAEEMVARLILTNMNVLAHDLKLLNADCMMSAEMIKAEETAARLILTNMNVLLARHSKLLNADCMMMLLQALANVLRGTGRMQGWH